MRRFSAFLSLALGGPLALFGFVLACNRTAPSEPEAAKAVDAAPKPMTVQEILANNAKAPLPGPPTDADFVKVGAREPDWDLDPSDPARDYVDRYVLSTQRYGRESVCVRAQASSTSGGRTLVEARDTSESGCTGTNAVRDTFAVDLTNNRMTLADPAVGKPLGDWPDGSGADALPGPEPKEGPHMEDWKTGVRAAIKSLQLVPLRVQFYGRGSYPLVSLAGWHGTVTPTSTPEQLASAAKTICAGSAQFPVGLISTMDRSRVLRIRCRPEGARWQQL